MPSTLSAEDIRQVIADALGEIAPEVDFESLDPDADLQTQADLDSMDFLALLEALAGHWAIDIPEADYPKLQTPAKAVAYLQERVGAGA